MRREKPRTYQGKVWKVGMELAPADLAVSVDMRGPITDPHRQVKVKRETLEYLQKHPEERAQAALALKKLFDVDLADDDTLEPEF